MSKPTRKDAEIIIRLAELGATMDIAPGTALIWSPQFEASPEQLSGTDDYGKVLQVMRWFETIGTLYRNGVVHEDLLFDWLSIAPIWDRLKPIAESQRKDGAAALWENFEYTAEKQRAWKPKRDLKAAKAVRAPVSAAEKVGAPATKNGASETS
jgi:hypothetical protein